MRGGRYEWQNRKATSKRNVDDDDLLPVLRVTCRGRPGSTIKRLTAMGRASLGTFPKQRCTRSIRDTRRSATPSAEIAERIAAFLPTHDHAGH